MSSKGSRVVPVRIPQALLEKIDAAVTRSVEGKKGEPWTRSSFIVAAVMDKLAHMERSSGRAADGLSMKFVKEAEGHRQSAYDAGRAWDCRCAACRKVREWV